MITGVVKLAPALPVDGFWPFLHLDRKFMHLGFHIYDVGFQSPNVDAARPMVFATTLLLLLHRRAAEPVRHQRCATASAASTRRRPCRVAGRRGSGMVATHRRLGRALRSSSPTPRLSWKCRWWRSTSLSLWYGDKHALKDVSMAIPKHRVTAFIGPSGCGKSHPAPLPQPHERPDRRRAHRRAASASAARTSTTRALDVTELRKRVGMVFQKSNPFPKSIFENVAYGPRIHGVRTQARPRGHRRAEPARRGAVGRGARTGCTTARSASRAASSSASASRARSPSSPRCSSWTSPARRSTRSPPRKIEELMLELKSSYTIVIVTHNMQQAARVSDYTAFMLPGRADRVRRDAGAVHQSRARSRPRTTSPAGSARAERTDAAAFPRGAGGAQADACSPWAAWSRTRSAASMHALVERDTRARPGGHRARRAGQRLRRRDRRAVRGAPGPAPAGGRAICASSPPP